MPENHWNVVTRQAPLLRANVFRKAQCLIALDPDQGRYRPEGKPPLPRHQHRNRSWTERIFMPLRSSRAANIGQGFEPIAGLCPQSEVGSACVWGLSDGSSAIGQEGA